MLRAVTVRLLLFPVLWLLCAPQSHAVQYEVVPCCSPCRALNDRANYNTGFLSIFTLLLQGKEDWLFRSDVELMTQFGPPDGSLHQLKLFSDMLKAHGTQLVIVYHPTRGLVHRSRLPDSARFDYAAASSNYRDALQRLRSTGVIVPDLSSLLNEPVQQHEYFFRRDHHWTPYGAERVARVVADELRRHPLYAELEKQNFTNRRIGMMRRTGTLQRAWQRLCGDTFADQYVDEFIAESVEDGAVGADQGEQLFGDKLPGVTLVGTSFSGGEVNYNFEGYLKEYLGVNVLNEAMAGGGAYDSMIRYLLSEEFRTQPPKLLVWETPSYHDLDKGIFYRQVYALMGDGCAGKPVELASTTRLKPGRNEILFNGGGEVKTLRGGNYLLDMQFNNPQAKSLNATIWYLNGRHERVKIDYVPSTENRGRFAVALRNDGEWKDFNFLSVDLNVEGRPPATSITARLCRDKRLPRVAGR